MFKRKMFLLGIGLFLLAGLLGTVVVGAQGGGEGNAGYVKEGDEVRWLASGQGQIDVTGMTPADVEALFPDSEEAVIVHQVPDYPVIVDGVRYEPAEITRFNGQVLRFVGDERAQKEGVIHAFTTVAGLEQYLQEQWGWPSSQESTTADAQIAGFWTNFYEHWWYGGAVFGSAPGVGWPDLRVAPAGWNDRISSVQVATEASWATLYEDVNFGGAQFWMQSGSNYPVLWWHGWNDRASSVIVWQ